MLSASAQPIQVLDLKPFVGPSVFESVGADWLLPRGRQVLGGIPYQIDGAILLYATNSLRRAHPARTNISNIPAGARFDRLHLLAGAQMATVDGTVLARIRLDYSDGTDAVLEIRYGYQVRDWYGPWHKADRPMKDPNTREVWHAQFAAAAAGDNYLRLFHSALTNPSPDKEVRSVSLESTKEQAALMVVALSFGPSTEEALPDTVPATTSPFPDLRPRSGEPVIGRGTVKTDRGQPIVGAIIKVMGEREYGATQFGSLIEGASAGIEVRTKDDGQFALPPLPDNKCYRLFLTADGFDPVLYRGLDPKSDPVEVRLATLSAPKPAGKYAVRARLIGPDDKPVIGAIIEPNGVSTATGTSWGPRGGFPEQVFSDSNGEFAFSRDELFTRLQVDVSAAGLAPANIWLDVTNGVREVRLGVGATVRGRLVKEGKPLAGGVHIGISGADRNSETYVGHFEVASKNDGSFVFEHLPADTSWYLYGILSSLKPYGGLAIRPVKTPGDGKSLELGDLEVTPGLHLTGEVRTRHGEPLPRGLRVRLGYENAWDSDLATVDKSGRFKFDGLYPGQVSITLDPRNWELASNNRSLDLWNPWRLIGMLEGDKNDLVLSIQKGQRQYSYASENGQLPQPDWPQNRPLCGAEASGPVPIVLAGRVVDDKTGQPVLKANVIPGYKPPVVAMGVVRKPLMKELLEPFQKKPVPWNERPFWQYSRAEPLSNGTFSVECLRLSSTPLLRVEAPGYLPLETDPISTNATSLLLRLKRGEGPNGIVLLPNGKPAEGATLLYAVSHEQFSLTGRELSTYDQRAGKQTTKQDGRFSFEARQEGSKLFVSHPQGWAEVSLDRGGDSLKLHLEPWATLKGTLLYSNGTAAAGIKLALTGHNDWQSGEAFINFQGQISTDAAGRFEFLDVPPRRMEVQRVIPMGRNGWTYALQTWLIVKPGITNDLGKVTYDQPPPPPAMEQLKARLGL